MEEGMGQTAVAIFFHIVIIAAGVYTYLFPDLARNVMKTGQITKFHREALAKKEANFTIKAIGLGFAVISAMSLFFVIRNGISN